MVNFPVKKNLVYAYPRARNMKKFLWEKLHMPTNWPPKDSSPLHPIEPLGKQFFVFNANRVRRTEWVRQGFWQGAPALKGPDGEFISTIPVMCVTDYHKRPFMFLDRRDMEVLLSNTDYFNHTIQEMNTKLAAKPKSYTWTAQREQLPKRSYTMQRTKKGEHKSWVVFKRRPRARRT